MQKSKSYKATKFSPRTVRLIIQELIRLADEKDPPSFAWYAVTTTDEHWVLDTLDEFLSRVGRDFKRASITNDYKRIRLEITMYEFSEVAVVVNSSLENITALFNFIEEYVEQSAVQIPVPIEEEEGEIEQPIVFIGHGGSGQWRDLKDHLHEQHGYKVVAYETGQRAGHEIRDIIEEMLDQSSVALLVMTGEDQQPDGTFRARQNVIHELGLFQGRLGFTKAAVLLEQGTESFSNINGVHQIRYSKDNIRETFGEVVSYLRRETQTDDED